MYSILASSGREADQVICAQRKDCGRNWRGFLDLHELVIATEFGLSFLSVPKRLLKGKRNAKALWAQTQGRSESTRVIE
jgi:hypothetical protein